LRDDELPAIVEGFRLAARNAMAAGFDGVEVHGANGYLLDTFLRDGSNHRSGPYGGALANRARLLFEVLESVAEETPLMGLRLSPLNSFNAMADSDPIGLITWLAGRLNDVPLAYLHLMRADLLGQQHGDLLTPAREHLNSVLVANMGYGVEEANAAIAAGAIDAVAFRNVSISRLCSSSLLLISRWAIQVPVSFGSAIRSPRQRLMACSISASSRPMLRTIASVVSRGVGRGGVGMGSTLAAVLNQSGSACAPGRARPRCSSARRQTPPNHRPRTAPARHPSGVTVTSPSSSRQVSCSS
jgi:hypothetical protein